MDLHPLHRPQRQGRQTAAQQTPFAHPEAYSSRGQWDQFSAEDGEEAARNRKVASEAARWKQEHDKMKEVSVQLAYKVEQATQAYKELQGRHQNLLGDHGALVEKHRELRASVKSTAASDDGVHQQLALKAEKWRARCASAQEELKATREKLQEELKATREKLQAVRETSGELARTARERADELERLKAEIPEVKTRLKQGKTAAEELASTKSALESAKAKLAEKQALKAELDTTKAKLCELQAIRPKLQSELDSAKAKLAEKQALQSELNSAKAKLSELEGLKAEIPEVKERLRATDRLKAELLAANEQVRAAAQIASARAKQHTADIQACANMLANAEQVLQACSELYARKEGSPLAGALSETATKLGQFIQNLQNPKRA